MVIIRISVVTAPLYVIYFKNDGQWVAVGTLFIDDSGKISRGIAQWSLAKM